MNAISPPSGTSQATPQGNGRFREGDIALVLAILLQVLEFFFAYPATVLKILLVSVSTFPGRAVFLPAILVSQFYASDFFLGDMKTFEYLLERHEGSRVMVLGFPLTTNYVFAICLTLRVLHEAIVRPRTFAGVISLSWIALWASCLIPAILSATLGKAEQKFSWTAPIRDVMMAGCLFYGMILARNKAETITVITRRLVPIACVLLTLAMCGYFYSRGMYFITALGPALFFSWRAFGGRAGRWALYAYLFTLSTLYAFALYPTESAKQIAISLYSTSGNSFALIFCWVAAAAITLFFTRNRRSEDQRAGVVGWLPLLSGMAVLMLPITFAMFSYSFVVDIPKANDPADLPLRDRFAYKLFHDRAPIWRGAIDEVLAPPYFVKPGGLTMGYALMLNGDKRPWPAGSHNLALEELRRNGWYSGLICLILILRGSVFALRAVLNATDPIVRAFAIASFCSLFILSLTSHIPMETNAALWLLGPAGMCAYFVQGAQRMPLTKRGAGSAHLPEWSASGGAGAYAH
jgi:hypothetical protein